MPAYPTVLVKCRFTRGGFGSERVFWVPVPGGGGEYRGLAYIEYCRRSDHSQLPEEEPPPGQSVDGYLSARVIRREGDGRVVVQVPDGELCRVDASIVAEPNNVPVGS